METVPTIEPEPEINPRTGLPYKQSAKLRAQKMAWRNKNAEIVTSHIRKWQANNRDKLTEYQVAYSRRRIAKLKYLEELFNDAIHAQITNVTLV